MKNLLPIITMILITGLSPALVQAQETDNSSKEKTETKSKASTRKRPVTGPISLDALIIEEKLQIPVFLTLERHKPEFQNLKMTKHFLELIIKSVEKNPF
jgi:hypothetical protein